jgi:carboxyl-terminal processing protease
MAGATMDQVVRALRGRPGTAVRVGFYRPTTEREFSAEITREVIRVESVRAVKLLEDDVGYIQLTQFAERTGREVKEALERLQEQGMRALVLDLRNNPGGLLTTAVEVAEAFFPRGELIVYTQGRNARDREEFRSGLRGAPVEVPIAVLINSGSASAAEIVAGSLKDTHRAVIVGERSFGKGSVQSIFRLKDGEALRLTTARYFTPSGVTLHEQGVMPDVELVMTPEEDRQLARQRARADLAADPELYRQRFGVDPVLDRQLETALDVLRAARLLDERQKEEDGRLTAAR